MRHEGAFEERPSREKELVRADPIMIGEVEIRSPLPHKLVINSTQGIQPKEFDLEHLLHGAEPSSQTQPGSLRGQGRRFSAISCKKFVSYTRDTTAQRDGGHCWNIASQLTFRNTVLPASRASTQMVTIYKEGLTNVQ